jgi:hypothetical protein
VSTGPPLVTQCTSLNTGKRQEFQRMSVPLFVAGEHHARERRVNSGYELFQYGYKLHAVALY